MFRPVTTLTPSSFEKDLVLDLDQDLVADLEAEQAEVGLDSSPQPEAEQLVFWQHFGAALEADFVRLPLEAEFLRAEQLLGADICAYLEVDNLEVGPHLGAVFFGHLEAGFLEADFSAFEADHLAEGLGPVAIAIELAAEEAGFQNKFCVY